MHWHGSGRDVFQDLQKVGELERELERELEIWRAGEQERWPWIDGAFSRANPFLCLSNIVELTPVS